MKFQWGDLNRDSKCSWGGNPLPSNTHHHSKDDCLEGKRENHRVCSVQFCVWQLCTVQCTHIRTDPTVVCWFDLAFYHTQWTARGSVFGTISLWFFLCVWNISRTAEWIYARFTRKTYLVPRWDEFEGQGQQGQKQHFFDFSALTAPCVLFMFGKTSLASSFCLCMKYLWNCTMICAKFTPKTCLVPCWDEFEGQGSNVRVTRDKKRHTHFWHLVQCIELLTNASTADTTRPFVSDIAIFVLKRHVKLQLTN